MPGKYRICAEFTLSTEITPEGCLSGIEDEVLDYEDDSYFSGEDVVVHGGSINFVIEADSEDEARERVDEIIGHAYYSGDDGIEWELYDGLSITEITEIEPPMDMERAKEIILAFLGRVDNLDSEVKAAFEFVIENLLTP